jgi:hypothetical protein
MEALLSPKDQAVGDRGREVVRVPVPHRAPDDGDASVTLEQDGTDAPSTTHLV